MPLHNKTIEEKNQLLQRRLAGEAVSAIAADIGVPKSTVYACLTHKTAKMLEIPFCVLLFQAKKQYT